MVDLERAVWAFARLAQGDVVEAAVGGAVALQLRYGAIPGGTVDAAVIRVGAVGGHARRPALPVSGAGVGWVEGDISIVRRADAGEVESKGEDGSTS